MVKFVTRSSFVWPLLCVAHASSLNRLESASTEIFDVRQLESSFSKQKTDKDCGNSFTGGSFFSIRCSATGQDICDQLKEFYDEFSELKDAFSKLSEYVRTIDSKPPMPGKPGRPGPRGEPGV